MKYVDMHKGERFKKVEKDRVKRFEEAGWHVYTPGEITPANPNDDQPKAKVEAKAEVVKQTVKETMTAEEEDANAGVVRNADGTVTADEHDFLQQNQGFIDDNLNPEED